MPKIINPFSITSTIPEPYFCDRKKETKTICRNLTGGLNTVLISPRRMGKTGLVKHCYAQSELREGYYTFYVDILQTSSLREFVYVLGREITNALASRSHKLALKFIQMIKALGGRISIDPITGAPFFEVSFGEIEMPEYKLDEIFQYLESADLPCIICIDEFQQITRYPEKNVEAILRSRIQHAQNSTFIFAGSERRLMTEMFALPSRPFYQSTAMLYLEPIEQSEYVGFATECFASHGKKISEESVKAVYSIVDGTTYYMQRLLHAAFSIVPEGGECGNEELRESMEMLMESYETQYRELLGNMSDRWKEVLFAVAARREVAKPMSSDFLKEYSLTASQVQSALRSLKQRELLTHSGGKWRVSDRLFALWLSRQVSTPSPYFL